MSSELSLNYLSKQLRNIYDDIKQKSTKNKWKSGLIGGAFLLCTGRYIYCKLYNWYHSLPPGPVGYIPRIGNTLTSMMNTKWNILWAIHYGVLFSVYDFSNKLTIYINDASIAKQILSKPNVLDRDMREDENIWNLLAADDNTYSFLGLNGKKWAKMRQLMHAQLTRFMQNENMHDIIKKYIKNDLDPQLKEICNNGGNIWFCREILSQLTFNIIFECNFGQNTDFETKCKELAQDLLAVGSWKILKPNFLLFLFPKLAPLIMPSSYFKPCYELRARIDGNIRSMIKHRYKLRKMMDFNKNLAMFPELEPEKNENDKSFMDDTHRLVIEEDFDYTESQQIADIYLMFFAGTDTTSISLEWGLILLSKQPNIQNKVRNELLRVLNKDKNDNIMYDINLLLQLPLFRACIYEILRISCVARLGVEHKINENTEDIWITLENGKKYRLPKGCRIRYNIEAIHYDVLGRENWKNKKYKVNAQQICLENWLKKEENTMKFYQNASFITFGHGKRDCIGKPLAIQEMTIILGYLLLHYKFSVDKKYMNMTYIPHSGGKPMPQIPGIAKPFPQIPLIIHDIKS